MSKLTLTEIKKLREGITEPPWECGGNYWNGQSVTALDGDKFVADCGQHTENARFIAASPDIADTCIELWEEVERLKRMIEEGITFEDIEDTRNPTHYPENR